MWITVLSSLSLLILKLLNLLLIQIPIHLFLSAAVICQAVRYYTSALWNRDQHRGDVMVMSGDDAFWAATDHDSYFMTINFLPKEPDVERLRENILNSILLRKTSSGKIMFPSYTRRIKEIGGRFVWEEDQNFRVENHVYRYHRRIRYCEQYEVISDLFNQRIEAGKPYWWFILVPFVNESDEQIEADTESDKEQTRCLLVGKIHHCYGDGINTIRVVIMGAFEDTQEDELKKHLSVIPKRPNVPTWLTLLLVPEMILNLAWDFSMLLFHHEPNPLHGQKLTKRKLLCWSRPIPISVLKHIRQKAGVSINDVMLSAIAGAVRKHCIRAAQAAPGKYSEQVQPVTAVSAVSLHKPPTSIEDLFGDSYEGNKLSMVKYPLAIDEPDPLNRLQLTKAITQKTLRSTEAIRMYHYMRVLGNRLPPMLRDALLGLFPYTLSVSNVPGPQYPTPLLGIPVNSVAFFTPQRGKLGLGFGLISYNVTVRFSVSVDEAIIKDMQQAKRLVDDIGIELEEMTKGFNILSHDGQGEQ